MSEQASEAQAPQLSEDQIRDLERQRQEFVVRAGHINDYCLDYGCFFSVSRIMGIEASYLEGCIANLTRTQPSRPVVYKMINDWFTALECKPFLRAYFIYRAQRTPFFKDFSHHLERGILHYYKGDFFSAVHVLVPAVEGILRLYVGGTPQEIGNTLVRKIKQTKRPLPYPEFASRRDYFQDILERFLREWFFTNTSNPLLATIPSSMNRNYILHLVGTDPYYSPSDCNRLFACFDVLLELVTLEFAETGKFMGLYMDDIPEVNERTAYYASLIDPSSLWPLVRANEERFMDQNAGYRSSRVPDWLNLLVTLNQALAHIPCSGSNRAILLLSP